MLKILIRWDVELKGNHFDSIMQYLGAQDQSKLLEKEKQMGKQIFPEESTNSWAVSLVFLHAFSFSSSRHLTLL